MAEELEKKCICLGESTEEYINFIVPIQKKLKKLIKMKKKKKKKTNLS